VAAGVAGAVLGTTDCDADAAVDVGDESTADASSSEAPPHEPTTTTAIVTVAILAAVRMWHPFVRADFGAGTFQ
jgi:hypothetical protein